MKGVDAGDRRRCPEASSVSVTCSPAKGIPATLESRCGCSTSVIIRSRTSRRGWSRAPTRCSSSPRGCVSTACATCSWSAATPTSRTVRTPTVLTFLRDLLAHDHGLERIGVAGVSRRSPVHRPVAAARALHAKQALITEAGVVGGSSTQMCFDAGRIRSWLQEERSHGLTLPIHLGVPGVVDRARLMTMGARLGVGTSLRYLSKNRATVMRMLAPGGYDPTDLVRAMAPRCRIARHRRAALVHVQQRRRHRQVARGAARSNRRDHSNAPMPSSSAPA